MEYGALEETRHHETGVKDVRRDFQCADMERTGSQSHSGSPRGSGSLLAVRDAVKERIVISFPGRRESVLGAFEQIIPDLHAPEKK